jgi:adenine-specific DNA-methyltransferase
MADSNKKGRFTKYSNKIGLYSNSKGSFINNDGEVVLHYPFKDTVLEAGMSKEDVGREERFLHVEIDSKDIDTLEEPKVLTDFHYVDKNGVKKLNAESDIEFFNTEGNLQHNLLIKGNNLLAINTLKEKLTDKIKLIYIDPPYNPPSNSNTFIYNNNFNHSSWLAFMRNRLEVSKKLLAENGVLICAIDENELAYVGVLIDEIFGSSHKSHYITVVHNPRGVQGSNFSYVHEYAIFVIPKGLKSIGDRKIDLEDIDWSSFRNWGTESLRSDARNCFYPVIIKDGDIVGFGDVSKDEEHPQVNVPQPDGTIYVYPIDRNGIERKWRYAVQSVDKVRDMLRAKEASGVWQIEIGKDFGQYKTVWQDPRYDANEYGTKLVKSLVPDAKFDFPKSLWNVYDCLYAVVADDPNAIVLDFFGGSGTTAHATLELNKDGGNRKFIVVEQMNYINTVTLPRIAAVIKNDGLSESFVYFELKKYNQEFVERIESANSKGELDEVYNDMSKNAFLKFWFDKKEFEKDENFRSLDLDKRKQLLVDVLDENQLYLNYAEMNDTRHDISADDKTLTDKFYGTAED